MILSFTKIIFQYLIINFAVIKAGIKIPEGAGTKTRKREEDHLPLVRSASY